MIFKKMLVIAMLLGVSLGLVACNKNENTPNIVQENNSVTNVANNVKSTNSSNLLSSSMVIEPLIQNSSDKLILKNTIDINSYIDNEKYKSYYCIGYDENKLYYILFSIDDSVALCYFELEKEKITYINENLKLDFLISTFVFNKEIYLVTNKIQENGKLLLEIIKVTETSTTSILQLSDHLKMPLVNVLNENIYLMVKEADDEKYYDIIYTFNILTSKLEKIEEVHYIQNDDNTNTGNSIVCMGGIEDTLYYEILELNNTSIEQGEGTPYIYSYSLKDKKRYDTTYKFDKPLNFISGDDNYIFTSDYNYYKPENNSGRLFDLNSNRCIYIPYINIAEDILDVKKINEDNYLIFNGKKILIYDRKTSYFEPLVSDDYYKTNIILKNNIMLYSYTCDEKVLTSIYEYNNDYYKTKFSEKLDSDLTKKISHKLIDSYIEPLYNEGQHLYYLETSNYKYRPYDKSEAIVWYYNKDTELIKEVYSYEWFYSAHPTYDNEFIHISNIQDSDGIFNIKINIKTGEVEKTIQEKFDSKESNTLINGNSSNKFRYL